MHSARLDLSRHAQSPEEVTREHRRGQAVLGVIGQCDSVVFGVDFDQGNGGSEGFCRVEVHVLGDAVHNQGPHAVGVGFEGGGVAEEHGGALGDGVRDEFLVPFNCGRGNKDGRGGVLAKDLFGGFGEQLAELACD